MHKHENSAFIQADLPLCLQASRCPALQSDRWLLRQRPWVLNIPSARRLSGWSSTRGSQNLRHEVQQQSFRTKGDDQQGEKAQQKLLLKQMHQCFIWKNAVNEHKVETSSSLVSVQSKAAGSDFTVYSGQHHCHVVLVVCENTEILNWFLEVTS